MGLMRRFAVLALLICCCCCMTAVTEAERQPPFARSLMSLAEVKQMLVSANEEAPAGQAASRWRCNQQVDSLLAPPRTAEDTWKAYTLLKQELALKPQDAELKYRTAEALLAYVRRKSDGNALRADGKHSDTRENRQLWRKHAPEALALLKEVKPQKGSEPLHAFLFAEAFMYNSCSAGIVKAAVKGDAFHFKANAKPLLEQHPAFGDGVGHTFLGAFYLGAPWPVHSAARARKHFEAARTAYPRCRRNCYYVGVEALWSGRSGDAREAFVAALEAPCGSLEEADIGEFLCEQSRFALHKLDSEALAAAAAGAGADAR